MAVGVDELVNRFRYHPPKEGQAERFQRIRDAALDLALLIDKECPDSREKSDSLTNLDYVVYQANAAIARREGSALS